MRHIARAMLVLSFVVSFAYFMTGCAPKNANAEVIQVSPHSPIGEAELRDGTKCAYIYNHQGGYAALTCNWKSK